MAAADMLTSQLRLYFYVGEDVMTGKPIYKAKTFNVHTDATAEDLFNVSQSLASLQERPLFNVERIDKSEIRQA